VKKRLVIVVILLSLILLLTSIISTEKVNATQCLNVSWGHMTPSGGDPELSREQDACVAVANWFVNVPGWNTWYAYGQATTAGNLSSTIAYRQNHDTWASDFWVGDFHGAYVEGYSMQWGWELVYDEYWGIWYLAYVYDWFLDPSLQTVHYYFYDNSVATTDDPQDNNIYAWTNWPYSKQHFTFIWTCACGNKILDPHNNNQYVYGFNDDINNTGIVGMPLAWTSRSDLSLDGYNSPDNSIYCYLGWNSSSLGMSDATGNINYDYYWFVYFFYQHLVGSGTHWRIDQSLNWASQQIWGVNWNDANNPLGYGQYWGGEIHKINVYGNAGMAIP
jgi:hypothetical protein